MRISLLFSTFILLTFVACNPMGKEQVKVAFKNPSAFKDLKIQVSSVSMVNNQLIISGSTLEKIKTVKLQNNLINETFSVESASDSQIIANSVRAFSFLTSGVFDLILADAYGAATFQVSFVVADGSITAAKLNSMGASSGQILKFNGTNWAPASQIDVQTYLGVYDATTPLPDVTLTQSGDYYIVSVAGGTYAVGDWIVSDGYAWAKLAYSKTSVASFQGRKGNVVLVPADYVTLKDTITNKITGSKLSDIADINVSTAPTDGQVLKWNSGTSTWLPSNDIGAAAGITLTDLSATAPLSYSNTTGVF
jgi:hypothetical protein